MSEIDEIKHKIDIVQLVSEYVADVKQAGTNWKARCPFHEEKTPSFMVSQEKQIFKCFGCGKGGDIFTFIEEIEGMEFPEALRLLAKKAGVQLKQQDPRIHSQKTRLIDIHKWATAYYQKVLEDADSANAARTYLQKRGLSKETAMDFRLGFAPNEWEKMLNFLKSKKFTESEINLAGLIKQKDQGSGYYDRFRNRIIFPIADVHGTIVGFGGRAMDEEIGAKYLNSPQTMIYDKSFTVYGLDKARQAIKDNDLAIFVEGYMDVISSHQAGVKNVVATSGTALTAGHIKLIKRYTNNVAFCFDQDLAGKAAASRSIDIALQQEANIKMIDLLYGKDPDECIQKDVELWKKSIEQAKPYMEYCLDSVQEKYNLSDIEQKKIAAKQILIQISKMQSKIEQDYWMKKAAELFTVDEKLLWEVMPEQKPIAAQNNQAENKVQKEVFTIYKRIFGLAISHPENIRYLVESLESKVIGDKKWQNFYNDLIMLYNDKGSLIKEDFDKWLQKQEKQYFTQGFFNSLVLLVQNDFGEFDQASIQNEIIFLVVESFPIKDSFENIPYKNTTITTKNMAFASGNIVVIEN